MKVKLKKHKKSPTSMTVKQLKKKEAVNINIDFRRMRKDFESHKLSSESSS